MDQISIVKNAKHLITKEKRPDRNVSARAAAAARCRPGAAVLVRLWRFDSNSMWMV